MKEEWNLVYCIFIFTGDEKYLGGSLSFTYISDARNYILKNEDREPVVEVV